ncbi:phage tail-collar fiber domain-containing protein [Pseudomonas azotoformans]
MTDQNSQFFAILTAVGEAKLANAISLGTSMTIAQMAVGDANDTNPIPNRLQTKLINERRRAPLNQVKPDPANASVIIAEQIIPETAGGWWIREVALYDADGDMVAVASSPPTYKPLLSQGSGRTQVIRINLIVSSTANIELKIDPSVVLATRDYVDTVVVEALSKLDYKHSVVAATTTNIVLNGIQTIDGELLPVGARVLVKDQTQAKDNGIYVVPAAGAWKRAQDADTSIEVTPGLFVSAEKGTVNGDSVWQLVTDAPIVLGTTALAFEMVAGRTGVSAGAYSKVTVDKYGRIIAGTNPTTLDGYGVEIPTQAEAEAQADHDNVKPMTVLRVWQAVTKRLVQATEGALGWAKVATQTLTDAGVDDKTIVTPKKLRGGFSIMVGPAGYIAFPSWLGGFIFLWNTGVATSAEGAQQITYPVSLTGSVWIHYVSTHIEVDNTGANGSFQTVGAPGLSSCHVFMQGLNTMGYPISPKLFLLGK